MHISPWYEPAWKTGGTATAAANICRGLAGNGVDVTVYTTTDAGDNSVLDVPINTEVLVGEVKVWYFQVDRCGLKMSSRKMAQKIKATIKNFDIIHIHGTRHFSEFIAAWYARKYAIPYIITPHASLINYWVKNIGSYYNKYFYIKLIDNRVVRNSALVHFLSVGEQANTSSLYTLPARTVQVANGIDIDIFTHNRSGQSELRERLGISDDTFLMLLVGRIHPQKNQLLVAESLAVICERATGPICCVFIGCDDDLDYAERLRLKLKPFQEQMRIIPSVSNPEMVQWYNCADLLIMPSVVEGVSMVMIEAMACGLPVLASSGCANADDLKNADAALVIEPDLTSFTGALCTLIADKQLLEKYAASGREFARKKYSRIGNCLKIKKVYQDLVR